MTLLCQLAPLDPDQSNFVSTDGPTMAVVSLRSRQPVCTICFERDEEAIHVKLAAALAALAERDAALAERSAALAMARSETTSALALRDAALAALVRANNLAAGQLVVVSKPSAVAATPQQGARDALPPPPPLLPPPPLTPLVAAPVSTPVPAARLLVRSLLARELGAPPRDVDAFEAAYEEHESLGHGATATVTRATARGCGTAVSVAVKRIDLRALYHRATAAVAGSDDCRTATEDVSGSGVLARRLAVVRVHARRLVREVCVLRALPEHSGLCALVDGPFLDDDSSTTHPTLIVVMRLGEGCDLFDRIVGSPEGRLERGAAKHIFSCVAHGVAAMHASGIAHRDIKPENVRVRERCDSGGLYDVALVDFGLAKDVSHAALSTPGKEGDDDADGGACIEPTGTIVGTPAFLAPEIEALWQAGGGGGGGGGGYDAMRADAFSLGVTLYVMLIGRFPEWERSHVDCTGDGDRDTLRLSDELWRDLGKNAESLVRGLTAVNPAVRLSVGDALRHPWLVADDEAPALLAPAVAKAEAEAKADVVAAAAPTRSTEVEFDWEHDDAMPAPPGLSSSCGGGPSPRIPARTLDGGSGGGPSPRVPFRNLDRATGGAPSPPMPFKTHHGTSSHSRVGTVRVSTCSRLTAVSTSGESSQRASATAGLGARTPKRPRCAIDDGDYRRAGPH